MPALLIKNVILNNERKDIYIKDGRIETISGKLELEADRVIDGRGKYAIPGFVNMHTHAAMTLMRGIGEDISLMDWLQNIIWPTEAKLTDELVYWGTKLACVEMIKSGTTCFNDQYWNLPAAVSATEEMGLRSVHSYVILDLMDKSKSSFLKEECERMYEFSKGWSSRNTFSVGVHAPYSVSPEMIQWAAGFARKRGLPVHIHISETEAENKDSIKMHGLTPTKYLDSLGVLGPETLSAHSLWVDDEDIRIFAERGVKAIHNINSNLKIASGYRFRYKELKEAGVVVSLGTDGCASSNNLDMLETMKTTALVQKAWREDPTIMPLDELLSLATENGGKSLGLPIGVIKEGYLADFSLIDTESVAFTPNINFMANLIYSANSSCVDTVICDGKVLMENRMVEGEQEIIQMVNKLYKQLL
ncbi:5-methylthioadenosine/S-adenosylhomocysteine deaminase [Bacteroidales bacterium CF]|jgi:Cytosine deaminase and related metal-dependent hydrolases|nr:5-methylthioadenosine/S-adenosylhomocysteine deaminase [Bacteroidales bacterium CF]